MWAFRLISLNSTRATTVAGYCGLTVCHWLSNTFPSRDSKPESRGPENANLLGKKRSAEVMKALEMGRSPCLAWVAPKCNHECPYERQAERDLTARHTEEKVAGGQN